MHFGKSRLQKIWFDKSLKSLQTDNMANGLKHCCNLNSRNFTIFIEHFEGKYVGKSFFSDTQNPKTVC